MRRAPNARKQAQARQETNEGGAHRRGLYGAPSVDQRSGEFGVNRRGMMTSSTPATPAMSTVLEMQSEVFRRPGEELGAHHGIGQRAVPDRLIQPGQSGAWSGDHAIHARGQPGIAQCAA